MTNQARSPKSRKRYDLEERTAKFGEAVIDFVRELPDIPINRPLISQVIRSTSSIGANYVEADSAVSRKDFFNKIGLCRKESKETLHWFRMLARANPSHKEALRGLWKEAHELLLIFSKIARASR